MSLFDVRFLTVDDVDALMQLEQQKWSGEQLPCAQQLAERIRTYPSLSIGAFCRHSGRALASLFMKPVVAQAFEQAVTWQDCARIQADVQQAGAKSKDLFGISLSSINAAATDEIFYFFYPHSLKQGWRSIYLGSPIPGYRKALEKQPNLCVNQYVQRRTQQLPADPQLRYYHKRGFSQIISVQYDYFPHEDSLDYGVIVRGTIPLHRWSPVLRYVPHRLLRRVSQSVLNARQRLKAAVTDQPDQALCND